MVKIITPLNSNSKLSERNSKYNISLNNPQRRYLIINSFDKSAFTHKTYLGYKARLRSSRFYFKSKPRFSKTKAEPQHQIFLIGRQKNQQVYSYTPPREHTHDRDF